MLLMLLMKAVSLVIKLECIAIRPAAVDTQNVQQFLMKPYVLSMQQKQQTNNPTVSDKEKTMSENQKKQPRTCLHVPDEIFQVLFKEARNQRVTVTEYILNVLQKEATNLNKGKWSHYHLSSAASVITYKE